MIININDQGYEFKTTLRVAKVIEDTFDEPYLKVLSRVTTAESKIDEQIKVLWLSHSTSDQALSQQEFKDLIYDNMGINQIMETIEKLINALQYPGMSETEIDEEVKKKIAKIKSLSSTGIL